MPRWLIVISALLLGWSGEAVAQTWPSKPIHAIVAFAAGSATDVQNARIFRSEMWLQLVGDRLESLEIVGRLGAARMRVGVFRSLRVVAIKFGLAGDAIGKARAAVAAHGHVVAVTQRPFEKLLPVQHLARSHALAYGAWPA